MRNPRRHDCAGSFYRKLVMDYKHIIHPIPPFYDAESRILILGSFPSIKTRESGFFYGHPQNRFWKLMALLFEEEVPKSVEEKKAVLKKHRIALWDSIASCDIKGSSDSSIKNAVPNDINRILNEARIAQIFTNGKKSDEVYRKYCLPATGREAICLPSTSPANAAWDLNRLAQEWQRIRISPPAHGHLTQKTFCYKL